MKRLILICWILCFLLCFCSCTAEKVENHITEDQTLHVVSFDDQGTLTNAAVHQFQKQYPEWEVQVDTIDYREQWWDKVQQLKTRIMAGMGPDVLFRVEEGHDLCGNLIQAGVYTDLPPFLEADPEFDRSQYHDGAWKIGAWKNGQYVLPIGFFTNYLVTTQQRLDRAGIQLEEDEMTYEKLQQIILPYLKREWELGKTVYFANLFPGINGLYFASDAQFIDFDKQEILFDTEENRLFLNCAKELQQFLPEDYNQPITYKVSTEELASDRYLFIRTDGDIRLLNEYEAAFQNLYEEDLRVFPMPAVNQNTTPVMWYRYSGVLESSDCKQQAFDFIKISLSEGNQTTYQNVAGTVLKSSFTDYLDGMRKSNYPNSNSSSLITDYLADTLEYLYFTASIRLEESNLWEVIQEEIEAYEKGTMSLDDCIASMTQKAQLYLDE